MPRYFSPDRHGALPLPERISLVAQVAEILRRSLDSHQWVDRLPSEHSLSEQLQVSRMTVRAAIKILVGEKRVQVLNGQRTRVIASRSPGAVKRGKVVAILAPSPLDATSAYAHFRLKMQERGVKVVFYFGTRYYGRPPNAALQRLVRDHPVDLWILLNSTEGLQRWFAERNIPAIVDGSRQAGVKLPALDYDYRAVCRHAASTLLRLGHKRILVLMIEPLAGGDVASELGFKEAFTSSRCADTTPMIVHCKSSVEHVRTALTRALRQASPPTAIFVQKWLAFTVLTHLREIGVRVPQDVAMLSRDDVTNIEYLVPSVAHYGFKTNVYAQRLVRMTSKYFEGTLQAEQEFLLPSFIPGASLNA